MSDNKVTFTVEDTGIGIPAYQAENIFTEFVQLDEYTDGTGIGLSIARSLARHMNGNVELDTSYIGGARFIMTLPLI
jgi:signal transduction histidine kinase